MSRTSPRTPHSYPQLWGGWAILVSCRKVGAERRYSVIGWFEEVLGRERGDGGSVLACARVKQVASGELTAPQTII